MVLEEPIYLFCIVGAGGSGFLLKECPLQFGSTILISWWLIEEIYLPTDQNGIGCPPPPPSQFITGCPPFPITESLMPPFQGWIPGFRKDLLITSSLPPGIKFKVSHVDSCQQLANNETRAHVSHNKLTLST